MIHDVLQALLRSGKPVCRRSFFKLHACGHLPAKLQQAPVPVTLSGWFSSGGGFCCRLHAFAYPSRHLSHSKMPSCAGFSPCCICSALRSRRLSRVRSPCLLHQNRRRFWSCVFGCDCVLRPKKKRPALYIPHILEPCFFAILVLAHFAFFVSLLLSAGF